MKYCPTFSMWYQDKSRELVRIHFYNLLWLNIISVTRFIICANMKEIKWYSRPTDSSSDIKQPVIGWASIVGNSNEKAAGKLRRIDANKLIILSNDSYSLGSPVFISGKTYSILIPLINTWKKKSKTNKCLVFHAKGYLWRKRLVYSNLF